MLKEVENKITQKHLNVLIDIELDGTITFCCGDSGTGKSFLYSVLNELSYAYKVQCYNYLYCNKREVMQQFMQENRGYLIVLDNADILLDEESREIIMQNSQNRYLIFGRNMEGLFLNKEFVKCIEFEDGRLKFENYLDHLRREIGLIG